MLSDYEEDEMFQGSINSSKLDEHVMNWSSISNKSNRSSSPSKSPSLSLDEIENESSLIMISKLNNTHLLNLLSDLVKTFFEITHEIENCLQSLNKKNLLETTKSSDHTDEKEESFNKLINDSSSFKEKEFKNLKDNVKNNNHLNSINQAHQQVNEFEDESICENVIPFRRTKQLKTNITQPHLKNNSSIILKESNTVNNSNYYEISCSYIIQLGDFQNLKNRIVEDKKNYISADINVNNCYKSKNELKINTESIDSDKDEAYSDVTTDFSDSLECPISYNFPLKSKQNSDANQENDQIDKSKNNQDKNKSVNGSVNQVNRQDINELLQQKMLIFNQSLMNLTKCENDLIKFKSSRDKFEIDELDSNYLNFLEKENLVFSLCTRLKNLISELIKLMKSISSGELDVTIADILNKNADLSSKLNYIKKEKEQIETDIKNLNEKESNLKLKSINYTHLMNEFKQNQDRLSWLKDKIEEIKSEINVLKEEQRKFEFKDCNIPVQKDQTIEDEDIFEDCLENIDYLDNEQTKSTGCEENVLFDRVKFDDVFRSIHYSSDQKNKMNLIDNEKFELNTSFNNLKNDIEQLALANEELIKEKQYQLDDYTQHLNCLNKLINSNKKFMNQQNYDRDNEKDTFDSKLTRINCLIKEKELSLVKCAEKCEFLKSDLDELLSEKDELQCKSYNQEKKLIDVNAKQEELKQSIDKLQNENNINFYRQEQLRKRVEEYEKHLEGEKLRTDKLKFDYKLELDPKFYEQLDKVMNEINKFQMREKIREHLSRKSIERKKNNSLKSNNNLINNKSSLIRPFKPTRSQSFIKTEYSTENEEDNFSLHGKRLNDNSQIQLRNKPIKVPRSKSFMINEDNLRSKSRDSNHRYSLKLNDDSYLKFISKLKSPIKRVLDDEELYSFKECQSLISLNNDLDDFSSFNSDSLFSLTSSSVLDEDLKDVDENFNILNPIDAKRSLSEDTFYYSLTSEDTNECSNLNDLYIELERCKDAEKLKYYALVISQFFQQITKGINSCKDSLRNTSLDNETKQMKIAELEKTYEQLRLFVDKEMKNLEKLQNGLNNKHLELSELKNRLDSNQDNSLFIENKQLLLDLDTSMIENEQNQFMLQDNLDHLVKNLKKKALELTEYNQELVSLKRLVSSTNEMNKTLKVDNQKLEEENKELNLKLKKLREAKLYKRLKMLKNSQKNEAILV